MAKGKKKISTASSDFQPAFLGEATQHYGFAASSSVTTSRRNRSSVVDKVDKYANINNLLLPFQNRGEFINISEILLLCVKAYYNIPIVRNTFDTMAELSNSKIILQKGNKASKDFVSAWFEKINLWSLSMKFFLEYFRSANVFMYRFDGEFTDTALKKLTQVFGHETKASVRIPIKYILLNPVDICTNAGMQYSNIYYKTLNSFEISSLTNPKTEEDKRLALQLGIDPKSNRNGTLTTIKLDPSRLYPVFYKKLDYEPFAVPMVYSVLEDLNWKMELKRMDQAIARTIDWAILLVTMGAKKEDGGVNPNNMQAMRELFQNESVRRVLVADYTTKAEWLLPDVNKILGSEKYKIVTEDIKLGLNIIFQGEEKFANSMIKTQIFLERLKEARKAFINDFLQPEIKRVCQEVGFKVYPEVSYEEISLKDELQFTKIYTRLMELGILTPDEGIKAMETGELPDSILSIENQKRHKQQKDAGLYQPLIGGAKDTAGRPEGTGTPQSTKNVSPIGTSASIDLGKFKENVIASEFLISSVNKALCKKFKIKKFTSQQSDGAFILAKTIMANEEQESWIGKVDEYVEKPTPIKESIAKEIDDLCLNHQVNDYMGILLYRSKK